MIVKVHALKDKAQYDSKHGPMVSWFLEVEGMEDPLTLVKVNAKPKTTYKVGDRFELALPGWEDWEHEGVSYQTAQNKGFESGNPPSDDEIPGYKAAEAPHPADQAVADVFQGTVLQEKQAPRSDAGVLAEELDTWMAYVKTLCENHGAQFDFWKCLEQARPLAISRTIERSRRG